MTAGGPHMERGEALLKRDVERCISGTAFDKEPVEEIMTRSESGYGTAAVCVFATDLAIHALGSRGNYELQILDAHRGLPQVLANAGNHVFVRIDVDAAGHLRIAEPKV